MELITEGMFLIAKDSPHILNYDYDYASEKERDFEPPPLEYQILLTYSITDTVTKDMESCFSTDCQETYNQTPVSLPSSHRKLKNCSDQRIIRNGSQNGLRNL